MQPSEPFSPEQPRPRARVFDEICVESGAFLLSGARLTDRRMDRWDDWPWADPAWLMVPHPEGILFRSGATSHYPTVDIELWTGTPPARDSSDWEAVDEAPLTVEGNSAEAQVRLWCIDGGGNLTGLHLPTQRPLRLRAHVTGRSQAEQRTDEFFTGVEHWLLEIFPDGDTITTHLWQ